MFWRTFCGCLCEIRPDQLFHRWTVVRAGSEDTTKRRKRERERMRLIRMATRTISSSPVADRQPDGDVVPPVSSELASLAAAAAAANPVRRASEMGTENHQAASPHAADDRVLVVSSDTDGESRAASEKRPAAANKPLLDPSRQYKRVFGYELPIRIRAGCGQLTTFSTAAIRRNGE